MWLTLLLVAFVVGTCVWKSIRDDGDGDRSGAGFVTTTGLVVATRREFFFVTGAGLEAGNTSSVRSSVKATAATALVRCGSNAEGLGSGAGTAVGCSRGWCKTNAGAVESAEIGAAST